MNVLRNKLRYGLMGLVVAVGLMMGSAAFARGHVSIGVGIGLPGVSLGYSNWGGYYAPAYGYAPAYAPAYYGPAYGAYAYPAYGSVYYGGGYARPYYRGGYYGGGHRGRDYGRRGNYYDRGGYRRH